MIWPAEAGSSPSSAAFARDYQVDLAKLAGVGDQADAGDFAVSSGAGAGDSWSPAGTTFTLVLVTMLAG